MEFDKSQEFDHDIADKMAIKLAIFTNLQRRRSRFHRILSKKIKKEAIKSLSGPKQAILNKLQDKQRLVEKIRQVYIQQMQLDFVRNAVLIRIPDETKLFIYHEFGEGGVADGILLGYVRVHNVRVLVDKLRA